MNKLVFKKIILFLTGFCIFITIEVLFRQYSYVWSGVLGGISMLLLDKINDNISWDLDLFWQAMIGGTEVTILELITGLIAKYTPLLPIMWDYNNLPLNFDGIICVPFSIVWILLSVIGILLADAINYYVFEDSIVPHYTLFKYFKFQFHRKYRGE